jgi:hypothetical protein
MEVSREDVERLRGTEPPVFPLKATDALAYPVIVSYSRMCRDFGCEDHAHEVAKAAEEFRLWQVVNSRSTHLPNHHHVPVHATQTE